LQRHAGASSPSCRARLRSRASGAARVSAAPVPCAVSSAAVRRASTRQVPHRPTE
jgi:hypothetical protein